MIAESGYLDSVLFRGLEDGEVALDLVGFVVDEDLYLLGTEGEGVSPKACSRKDSVQHQLNNYINQALSKTNLVYHQKIASAQFPTLNTSSPSSLSALHRLSCPQRILLTNSVTLGHSNCSYNSFFLNH